MDHLKNHNSFFSQVIVCSSKIVHSSRANNSAPNCALIGTFVSFPLPISGVHRGYSRETINAFYHRFITAARGSYFFSARSFARAWIPPLLFSLTGAVSPINYLSSTDFDLNGEKNQESLALLFLPFSCK